MNLSNAARYRRIERARETRVLVIGLRRYVRAVRIPSKRVGRFSENSFDGFRR